MPKAKNHPEFIWHHRVHEVRFSESLIYVRMGFEKTFNKKLIVETLDHFFRVHAATY